MPVQYIDYAPHFWANFGLCLYYMESFSYGWHLKLRKIQRRATKLISSLENLSYDQRHQQLNLPTLIYRHTRMNLIMTYKILHGMASLDKNDFFILNTNHTRSNGLKIHKHRCNTIISRTSFSQRVISDSTCYHIISLLNWTYLFLK